MPKCVVQIYLGSYNSVSFFILVEGQSQNSHSSLDRPLRVFPLSLSSSDNETATMQCTVLASLAVLALIGAVVDAATTATTGPWPGVTDITIAGTATVPTIRYGATVFEKYVCIPSIGARVQCLANGILHAKMYAVPTAGAVFPCDATGFALDADSSLYSPAPYRVEEGCADPSVEGGCANHLLICSTTDVDGHLGFPRYQYALNVFATEDGGEPTAIGAVNAADEFMIGTSTCHVKAPVTADGRYYGFGFVPDSAAVAVSCIAPAAAGATATAKDTNVVMNGEVAEIGLSGEAATLKGYILLYNVKNEFDLKGVLGASMHTVDAQPGAITTASPVTTATDAPTGSASGVLAATGVMTGLMVARSALA